MEFQDYLLIGNGAHWNVYRAVNEDIAMKKVVYKVPIYGICSIIKSLKVYKVISKFGLPTLLEFSKTTIEGVECIQAEDLNPKMCDGFYVSPNTVKNSESCASLFLNYLNFRDKSVFSVFDCSEFEIQKCLQQPERIELLRDKRILKGAEKTIYENKICEISNFEDFLKRAKEDLKRASDNQIELFSDAFFFKVSNSNNTINYKIADFDCIVYRGADRINTLHLYNANKDYFKTSIDEYIEFFVEMNKRKYYRKIITNVL